MNNGGIQITGITPISNYPCHHDDRFSKEICETDKSCIPCQKPNMKDIIEIIVCITITSFKLIYTPEGKKLIIDGLKHIKLIYVADNSCQNVQYVQFDIPFCDFIFLQHSCKKVICIKTAIEHISVYQISYRDFAVSTIILLCPILKKHHHHRKLNKFCNGNSFYDNSNSHDGCTSYNDCGSDDASSLHKVKFNNDYNYQEDYHHHKNCNTVSNNPHCDNHSNYNNSSYKNYDFVTNFHFSTSGSNVYYCDTSYPTHYVNQSRIGLTDLCKNEIGNNKI